MRKLREAAGTENSIAPIAAIAAIAALSVRCNARDNRFDCTQRVFCGVMD